MSTGAPPPTFFLIGAARAGTTALAEVIREHPDGFVTKPKEPHFLAFAGTRPRFVGPGDDALLNRVAVTDIDEYRGLYAGSEAARARGDASTSTLYYADRSIDAIERYFPAARCVVLLRDPVERAFSAFQYMRARGFEPLADFDDALDAETERVEAGWHHIWHYERMGHYGGQLSRFWERLGPDRVHVVLHDELKRSPAEVVAQLDAFLGLPPRPAVEAPAEVNVSGVPRSAFAGAAARLLERNAPLKGIVRRVVPFSLRERLRRRGLVAAEVPSAVRDRLAAGYAADVAFLRTWLGPRAPWLEPRGGDSYQSCTI